jgi:ribonuclease P protein component
LPGFSKQERLLKRADYLRLSGQAQKVHTTNFVVLWCKSSFPNARIGITVSRKVGNSVTRNWLKRLIREFYRHNKNLFGPDDYNIIAKQGAARLVYSELSQELGRALQRHIKQQC